MRRPGPIAFLMALLVGVQAHGASSAAPPPEVVSQFESGIIEVENDGRKTEIPYRIRRPGDLSPDHRPVGLMF